VEKLEVTGELAIPAVHVSVWTSLWGKWPVLVNMGEPIYFDEGTVNALRPLREHHVDMKTKAVVRVEYREGVFGHRYGTKLEVVTPGWYPTPK